MDIKEYIEKRVNEQIEWYDKKSKFNKKWYLSIRTIEFTIAILIPFLASYIASLYIGLMGVIVAICAGMLTILKFHDNWIKYRRTSEMLKYHLNIFENKVEPYNDEDSYSKFVRMVESTILNENNEWQNYIIKDKV